MKDFRSLKIWEKSHLLTLEVYKVTTEFPQLELYGLTSQMRRAAASVPTNIAEGCGRDSDPELRRFLRTAMGSASELEYQLLLSHDLAYFSAEDYKNLNDKITEVKRMLAGFIKKLNADC